MAEITKEQYEELPEFMKETFIEDGEGYSHKGFLKVKSTADGLDAKLKAAGGELSEYKSAEQERIDAAKKEAYDQAIKDGNTEEMAKRHAEQLEDAELRALERGKNEAKAEFIEQQNKEKADKTALKISAIGVDDYARELIYQSIKSFVTHVDGEDVFLDESGRATSLNYEAFKESVKNNPRYARLVDDTPAAVGGGGAKGSESGRAAGKKPHDMNSKERLQLKQDNPEEFKRLFL